MTDTAAQEPRSATLAPPLPRDERLKRIGQALETASSTSEFVPSEHGYLELPVVSLSPAALVYRIDNGRILSELATESRKAGLSRDDVQTRGESPEVQQILHKLLIEKAKDPDGPIFEELKHHAQQTSPLLVRHDGVVVNGNRRLAAMRELAASSPASYGHFDTVSVAVLSEDIDREQQEYIEAALQMAPDLKLDYGWVNRRLKIRQHVGDLGLDRIISAYRFRDGEAVEKELRELELAESYLDWCSAPRQYERLAEDEDCFIALDTQLTALPDNYIRRVWKTLGFAMLKASPQLDSRIDHYFPFTSPDPNGLIQWVPRTIAEDHGLTGRQARGQNTAMNPRLVDRLVPLLDQPAQAEATARSVIALIDTLKSDQKRILGANRAVHALRTARNTLESLQSEDMTDEQLRRLRADHAAVQELIRSFSNGNVQAPTRDPLLPRLKHRLGRLLGR